MKNLNSLLALGVLSVAVTVTGLTGCSTSKEAKQSGRLPAQVKSDDAMSKRVADSLQAAPIYKYPGVKVNTFDNAVQLSGFVHTDSQKQMAAQIAQQTPGVKQVRNDLVVQPLTPTGRTEPGTTPQPYHAPVITPPQEGAQEPPKQPMQPQPDQSTQPQPNQNTQPH